MLFGLQNINMLCEFIVTTVNARICNEFGALTLGLLIGQQ